MVHWTIPQQLCLSYTHPKAWLCRINMNDFVDALKDSRKKHRNVIQILQGEKNIIFDFYSKETGRKTLDQRTLSFTPLELKTSLLSQLPPISQRNSFTLPALEWKRLFMGFGVLGQYDLFLDFHPTHLEIRAQSSRSRKSACLWPCQKKDRDPLNFNSEDIFIQRIPLRDVNFLSKASALLEELTISTCPASACAIRYNLKEGILTYYIT